ncbi:MAG: tetratricopeptide repeat protein [Bacteroidales bacterium]|nr:tetratricopeptide repeat protein [Bacteroidales bacterium]
MRVFPLRKLAFLAAVLTLLSMPSALSKDTKAYKTALDMYRHGMYERAMALFEQQAGDDLCEDYALLCAVKLRSRNCGRRVEAMDAAHPKTMINSAVHYEYALLLFDEGEYAKASEEFAKVSKTRLSRAELSEYWYKKGFAAYNVGNMDEAGACFLECTSMESQYLNPSRFALGSIAYGKSDFEKAASWFELTKTDERFRVLSEFYLVDCHFMMKDYTYVVTNGEKIFPELTPESKQHMSRLLSESYLVVGDAGKAKEYLGWENISSGSSSDYFHAGSVYYALGDYSNAVKYFEQMTDRTDSIGQIASYQLGHSYIKLKNKVKAMNAFKEASAKNYDDVIKEDAFFNYAKLAFDLDGNDSVFADYIAKYNTSRKGEMIYDYLAMSSLRKRDYAAAVEAYDNIDDLTDAQKINYVKANYLRAEQLIRGGAYKDAVRYLKAASAYYFPKSDRFNQLCRYTLAETYYRTEQYDAALKLYNELYNLSALDGRQEGKLIPYGIAYTYFKKGDYAGAAKWFDNYIKSKDSYARADAMLRRADCDFARKDYSNAAANYQAYINEFPSSTDIYPYYHQGVAYGLVGDKARKVKALSMVKSAIPGSKYYNKALYELGRAYNEVGDAALAINAFETLEENTIDKEFIAKARMGKGMVLRNSSKFDEALACYKQVVADMPGTDYSNDALLSIQSIYNAKGHPEEYIAYLEANNLSTGTSEADRMMLYYNTAEQVFLAGNYSGAVTSFIRFISQYPDSKNVPSAYYYLAESYKNLGQKEKACEYYRKSIDEGLGGSYAELAMVNYASLSYSLEHFEDAYTAYSSLLAQKEMLSSKVDAMAGKMRSAYRARMYGEAITAARAVDANADTPALRREALYIQAKSNLVMSQRDEAFKILKKLANEPSTAEGAEARYLIIQSSFDAGNFTEVENQVYDFAAKAEDQSYWLAKAFIVLGDSFVERGNIEQAVVTYESVRDGYTPSEEGDDVLDTVEHKLATL